MYNFDIKLKEKRKERGVSQKKLAELLSTTQQQISKYENLIDTPSLSRLVEIAQILGVTLDELVNYKKVHEQYSTDLKAKMK